MDILRILRLTGPNVWSKRPALEAWVDIGVLEDAPSNLIPGFTERLVGFLPSLIEHRCSVGERGGFLKRLEEGTWAAHILEHVALELQTLAGSDVGFGRAREMSRRGHYRVALRYEVPELAEAALYAGRDLLLAAVEGAPFDVARTVARLAALGDRLRLGPSTRAIVEAAAARGFPSTRLNDGSLVTIGQGFRQRRIWTAETDRTSAIGSFVAQDKALTKALLGAAGIPVPQGRPVTSAEEAWAVAEELGTPVVVKPLDANHARGVFVNIHLREHVERAFTMASREGSGVLVESFIPGSEHRLLVVGDRLVAASRGDPAAVVGDGARSIRRLVEEDLNGDPRRGDDEHLPLSRVELDGPTLMQLELQGFGPDDIPPPGCAVVVQRNDNLTHDVTDAVHPETAAFAVTAARLVGLDIAGIDAVATDIALPLGPQSGGFVEVNSGPGLAMHLSPAVGTPRPCGQAIVDLLFPPGAEARVPVVAVTGSRGRAEVTQRLEAVLAAWHPDARGLATATARGLRVGARRLDDRPSAHGGAARRLLMHPDTRVALVEASGESILEAGLGFDACAVAVVTDVALVDAYAAWDVHDVEKVFAVERCAVDVLLPRGARVLPADDALALRMAALGPTDAVTILFADDPDLPALREHLERGGQAVTAAAAASGCLLHQRAETRPLPLPLPRSTNPSDARALAAAVAAVWALGVLPSSPFEEIEH